MFPTRILSKPIFLLWHLVVPEDQKMTGWEYRMEKEEGNSLKRMSWAIVEELHANTADGDKLKAYVKSPRCWKTQHFSSLMAFYIVIIPAPLSGSQQWPWELNKAGSELTPALSLPATIQGSKHFLCGRWESKKLHEFI